VDQTTDVEKLIGELEIAVDRLRSLYEQYFVGIEKIQPAVPRKDVDRKIHLLRKEQIRNTALRFRFQMVLQKYNTYQTHWQRVCREIENGTYKRHLIRAQRRYGSTRPPARASKPPPSVHPEPGAPVPDHLTKALAELDRDFEAPSFDVDVDLDDRASRPPPASAPAPGARSSILPPPLVRSPPAAPPPMAVRSAAPGAAVWKKVAPPVPPGPAPPAPGARAPGTSGSTSAVGAVPPGASGPMAPVSVPRIVPPGASGPMAPVSVPRVLPPGASGPMGPVSVPRVLPPGASGPMAPVSVPRPLPPGASGPMGPVSVPRVLPPGASGPMAPVSPPSPSAASRPPLPPRPAAPAPAPAAPPAPAASPAAVSRPAASAELPDFRLREIYADLVDAKRKQNESTAGLTYQAVAKSLRESGDRLRQKHGKSVDFEVAVKDGKTILRPVLK
jgi:hypothetical protein